MHPVVRLPAFITQLKDPEYTGVNRCIPCTLFNLLLSVVLASVVGLAVDASGWPYAVSVAAFTFGLAALTIYLRGYLVPRTPTLTKRYLPARVRRWFKPVAEPLPWDDVDPTDLLVGLGVIVDDPAADDLALNPVFLEAYRESMTIHWADEARTRERVAALADIDPETIEFQMHPGSYRACADGQHLATWPSRPACVADAAAASELDEWDPEWAHRPPSVQTSMLGALRLFVERCPGCDGPVSLSYDVVESCCWTHDVVAATCEGCGARLFEMGVDPEALRS